MFKAILTAAALLAASAASAASPAATQQWVRNYCSTSSVTSAEVAEFVAEFVRTSGVTRTSYVPGRSSISSNTVDGIIGRFRYAGARARASATNDVWAASFNDETNTPTRVLAPVDGNWINVPNALELRLASVYAWLYEGGYLAYSTTNFTGGACTLYGRQDDPAFRDKTVYIFQMKTSDAELRKAKGE